MAAQADDSQLSELTPGGETPPLKIRLIRKWNPTFHTTQTTFLFIDKEGTAIQANAKGSEQRIVENRLRMGSCYIITKYGCGNVDPYSNILGHSTHLVIGGATQFTPIADIEEIPRYYFDFASRDRMEAACEKDNETIEGPRLQSTAATYIYQNPLSIHTDTLLQLHASGIPPENSVSLRSYPQNAGPDTMISIQDILTRSSAQLANKTFVVIGEISHIVNKEWCYIACPLCGKTLTRVLKQWFCPKDDIIDNALYSYRLSGIISDGTGSIDATFFNDVVVQLIELPCDNIIQSDPNIDMHRLPSIIQSSIGTHARFHLQANKNERNGSIRCTINRVVLLNPRPATRVQQQNAPVTPQQQLTQSAYQPSPLVKRQLKLNYGESSSETTKKAKSILETTGKKINTPATEAESKNSERSASKVDENADATLPNAYGNN
ncbi:hypothetical protein QVD17_30265 [Tagetes erecta]|uniref:Replication factor A C-terminal domain-containing protein n=1 Tax=Tagetes erecta TaxID=13708 RepID=A0AAD8K179_TARER|nr:hypothetical protein QVD17_30265 [Tagetes erecta]